MQTDYLVIGSGIAGLSAALMLSELGPVMVVTKGKLKEANTYWAQGGIAAVMQEGDSFDLHAEDTIKAGAEHNDPKAVKMLVENGPKVIRYLQSLGVKFQGDPVMEAGHSVPRVWRTSDFTGQDILNVLIKKVKRNKAIKILEEHEAVELIVNQGNCQGAFVRKSNSEDLFPLAAKQTILATGGLGQLFEKTTNTLGSSGEGIALAMKAGAKTKDLEFVQFHPTALNIEDIGRYFLLSEVLRGYGAKVINSEQKTFLEDYDKRGELAPRDVVTRGIHFEEMNGPVYMTLKHLDPKTTVKTFPNTAKKLKRLGFDLTQSNLPITPVAHYACGGVETDLKAATTVPGLFALGEVACTGVHGANRLASNSLLEAVVFAIKMKDALEKSQAMDSNVVLPESFDEPHPIITEDLTLVKTYAKRIQKIMWEHVGIVRTQAGLELAKKELDGIPARDYRIQNRKAVCFAMIEAALSRPESLGSHYITTSL